jgi:hypothetical protein
LPNSIDDYKFIILVSDESLRSLLHFKNENFINYPIYIIEYDSLSIPLESLNFPYFFVVDKNFKVTNVFYPLTSMPELTEDYFRVLKNKYQQLYVVYK